MKKKKKTKVVQKSLVIERTIDKISHVRVVHAVITDPEKSFTKKNHLPRFTIIDETHQINIKAVVQEYGIFGSKAIMERFFPEMERASLAQVIRHNYNK